MTNIEDMFKTDRRYQLLTDSGFNFEQLDTPCEGDNWLIHGIGGCTGAETQLDAIDTAWAILGLITLRPVDDESPGHLLSDEENIAYDAQATLLKAQWAKMAFAEQVLAINLKRENYVMPAWQRALADEYEVDLLDEGNELPLMERPSER